MRLEWPLVFRREDPRRTREDRADVAGRDRDLPPDDGRLTDVVVECRHFGKGGGSAQVTLSGRPPGPRPIRP